MIDKKLIERFWGYVDVKGEDECWEWKGSINNKGYGVFWDGKKKILAHRFVYELMDEPIEDGMKVCHTCDNTLCCNTYHLWKGTQAENLNDMVKKGRHATSYNIGEDHPRSKLKEEDIICIRILLQLEYTKVCIAKLYNISDAQIGQIERRVNWGWV